MLAFGVRMVACGREDDLGKRNQEAIAHLVTASHPLARPSGIYALVSKAAQPLFLLYGSSSLRMRLNRFRMCLAAYPLNNASLERFTRSAVCPFCGARAYVAHAAHPIIAYIAFRNR